MSILKNETFASGGMTLSTDVHSTVMPSWLPKR
jgi:hypothetical protein